MTTSLALGLVVGALVLASGVVVVAARRRIWSEGALGLNSLALGGLALLLSKQLVALALAAAGLAILAMALQTNPLHARDQAPPPRVAPRSLPAVRLALCVLLVVGLAGVFWVSAGDAPALGQVAEDTQVPSAPQDALFIHYGPAILGLVLVALAGILAWKDRACSSG